MCISLLFTLFDTPYTTSKRRLSDLLGNKKLSIMTGKKGKRGERKKDGNNVRVYTLSWSVIVVVECKERDKPFF